MQLTFYCLSRRNKNWDLLNSLWVFLSFWFLVHLSLAAQCTHKALPKLSPAETAPVCHLPNTSLLHLALCLERGSSSSW